MSRGTIASLLLRALWAVPLVWAALALGIVGTTDVFLSPAWMIVLLGTLGGGLWLWAHRIWPRVSTLSQGVGTAAYLLAFCVLLGFGSILTSMSMELWNQTVLSGLVLRFDGRAAFVFFALALCVSPVATLLRIRNTSVFLLIRKVLGTLAFLMVARHFYDYALMEWNFRLAYHPEASYLGYFFANLAIRPDAMVGMVAGVGMLALGVTSNTFSSVLLGKKWKSLHLAAYPLFALSMLHIVLAGRFDALYASLVALVSCLRFAVWISTVGKSSIRTNPSSNRRPTRYLCVVCGYIYDEALGDVDGGLAPGTKFEDIPDTWVCPVCGVTKADFEPIYDDAPNTSQASASASIVSITYLTADVIELVLSFPVALAYIPGQFLQFILHDFDGDFKRSYSIASATESTFTFLIRIKPDGRAGRFWKQAKAADTVGYLGVFGAFTLKNTPNPKVFIATGTGLAPVYAMAQATPQGVPMRMLFSVRNQKDIFYEENLRNITGLQTDIFLSQEATIEGYRPGRINLLAESFASDTEFYLCGNPQAVEGFKQVLAERGYMQVYAEVFL